MEYSPADLLRDMLDVHCQHPAREKARRLLSIYGYLPERADRVFNALLKMNFTENQAFKFIKSTLPSVDDFTAENSASIIYDYTYLVHQILGELDRIAKMSENEADRDLVEKLDRDTLDELKRNADKCYPGEILKTENTLYACEIAEANRTIADLKKQLRNKDAQIREQASLLLHYRNDFQEAFDRVEELTKEIKVNDAEIEAHEEQARKQAKKMQELRDEIEASDDHIETLKSIITDDVKEAEKAAKKHERIVNRYKRLVEVLENDAEEYNDKIQKLEKEIATLKKDTKKQRRIISRKDRLITIFADENEELQQKYEDKDAELVSLIWEIASY